MRPGAAAFALQGAVALGGAWGCHVDAMVTVARCTEDAPGNGGRPVAKAANREKLWCSYCLGCFAACDSFCITLGIFGICSESDECSIYNHGRKEKQVTSTNSPPGQMAMGSDKLAYHCHNHRCCRRRHHHHHHYHHHHHHYHQSITNHQSPITHHQYSSSSSSSPSLSTSSLYGITTSSHHDRRRIICRERICADRSRAACLNSADVWAVTVGPIGCVS